MATFVCDPCRLSFSSQRLLSSHNSQKHRDYAHATCHDGTELCLRRSNGSFTCICSDDKTFDSIGGFRKHFQNGKCPILKDVKFYGEQDVHESEDDTEISDEELGLEQIPAARKLTNDHSHGIPSDWSTIKETKREYDHAVLHACSATDYRPDEQKRLLTIMDSYHLRPLSLCSSNDDVERNALTHETHLQSLHESSTIVTATAPKKRKLEPDTSTTRMEASLYSALISAKNTKSLMIPWRCFSIKPQKPKNAIKFTLTTSAFNESTNDIRTRPYTVFTLCEYDNANEDSNYRVGSLLLQQVANSMLKGIEVIDIKTIHHLRSKMKKGDMLQHFDEIIDLLGDKKSVNIIANNDLNDILQRIASSLSPQLTKAN
ncbi:predicted protein [Lichtheimia corymbifera JMRC:FSU:9682]|uniref:C2H2-type domain-containing protein n=1 Tax=Lichtheimia corymbifera JMRC:FSU:9682 TaxID=1263082 RepID=A0A068SDF4_9FUNG|nr:predicted protein [Lichtheimia corymbifera JMRC:FSU:9682]